MDVVDPIPNEDYYRFEPGDGAQPHAALFAAFNTVVQLQAYGAAAVAQDAFAQALDACRRYERLFSRTLPHSDIARLNTAGGVQVPVDPETFALLQAAVGYCARSRGVFDITVGPAVALWDFHTGVQADPNALARAVQHVDYRAIELSGDAVAGTCTVRLADPLAQVDLGGIAKGYIADALTALLDAAGVCAFVVDLGGNVVVHGAKPDGTPWKVGVRDPQDTGALLGALSLEGGSVVTSGVYERGFDRAGVRFHHILDPLTGYPVDTDVTGVSVVADRSIDAEGFSTTLLALGLQRGMEFAREQPEIRTAVFVDADNALHQV